MKLDNSCVMFWLTWDYLLLRTRGPGFAVWLCPEPAVFSERRRPWWRRQWPLRTRWIALSICWGKP